MCKNRIGQNLGGELFHQNRHPVMLLDYLAHLDYVVTVDSKAYICLWRYHRWRKCKKVLPFYKHQKLLFRLNLIFLPKKLCLAIASHNFIGKNIIQICDLWDLYYVPLAVRFYDSYLTFLMIRQVLTLSEWGPSCVVDVTFWRTKTIPALKK